MILATDIDVPIEQHPFSSNRWLQNVNNPLIEEKWFVNRNTESETISFGFKAKLIAIIILELTI